MSDKNAYELDEESKE
jgi:hypothetical protein